jgi:hypothetical protein
MPGVRQSFLWKSVDESRGGDRTMYLYKQVLGQRNLVCVYDPRARYASLLGLAAHVRPGLPRLIEQPQDASRDSLENRHPRVKYRGSDLPSQQQCNVRKEARP